MVKAQVIRMSFSCTSLPSLGALATCRETSILLLPVANVTFPLSSRSQISLRGCFSVIRSTAAVTVMTASPVCLYETTPAKASRSMKMVPSLMCPEEFIYESKSQGSRANGNIYLESISGLRCIM